MGLAFSFVIHRQRVVSIRDETSLYSMEQSAEAKTKSLLVEKARIAEECERYEDMAEAMKSAVETGLGLDSTERNLLSIAYKNLIGSRRSAWRICKHVEDAIRAGHTAQNLRDVTPAMAAEYMQKIEGEIKSISAEILDLLANSLANKDISECLKKLDAEQDSTSLEAVARIEAELFYYKMQGDYNRYLAEVFKDDKAYKDAATAAYENALKVSEFLVSTNPVRLGLMLNYSVYYYEIIQDMPKACQLAKEAFDNAINELEHLAGDSYRDSSLIMQLLRDNLTLWTSQEAEHDQEMQDNEV